MKILYILSFILLSQSISAQDMPCCKFSNTFEELVSFIVSELDEDTSAYILSLPSVESGYSDSAYLISL